MTRTENPKRYIDYINGWRKLTKGKQEKQLSRSLIFARDVGTFVTKTKEEFDKGFVPVGKVSFADLPEVAQKFFEPTYTTDMRFGVRVNKTIHPSDFLVSIYGVTGQDVNAFSMQVWRSGELRFSAEPFGVMPLAGRTQDYFHKLDENRPLITSLRLAAGEELLDFATRGATEAWQRKQRLSR